MTKADILGKWSVFFFYPADFTFVCPTELADLADKYEEFQDAGCEIYSVSCDTHYVHKAWHDASETIQKIHYPMLADPTGALARDFDVMIEDEGVAERGSFIVNPEGKIVAYGGDCGKCGTQRRRAVQKSTGLSVCGGTRRSGLARPNGRPGEESSLKLVLRSGRTGIRRLRHRPRSCRCGFWFRPL